MEPLIGVRVPDRVPNFELRNSMDQERIKLFLFFLLRDYLTIGEIYEILKNVEIRKDSGLRFVCTENAEDIMILAEKLQYQLRIR